MKDKLTVKPPLWFWISSTLALVWNIMGVMAYLEVAYMSNETLAQLPEAERILYETQPAWVTAAFAIAVFGGALGCVLLLLQKKWAKPVLVISLIGVLSQMSHSFFMSNSFDVYGPGGMVMPLMVIIVGFGLVFFAKLAIKRHWIS